MVVTGFDGLVQLGVFTIAGLIAAAATTRFVVPQGLPARWHGQTPDGTGCPPPRIPPLVASGVPLLLLTAALAVPLVSGERLWEEDVAALSPIPDSLRAQDKALREALPVADFNHLLLIRGDSAQAVLQQQEALSADLRRLQQQGDIEQLRMAAQWLPSQALQWQRQAALPDGPMLSQAVSAAQQGLPFREGAFAPFIEQVAASRELPPLTLPVLEGTLLGARIAPLLFERDGKWWGVVRLSGVRSGKMLAGWVAAQALPDMHYLNLKAATNRMVNGFRDAALDRLGWGGLLIALLLWWGLRSWKQVLRVVLPVAAAIALSVASLHLLGERLTLFHLTALLLVLGIGIDYSLFFSRPGDADERRRTGHALLVCAISTLTVFGILALSSLPVLHAIGLTVFFGVSGSYAMAWLAGASTGAAETGR
jgi:predicted exporter